MRFLLPATLPLLLVLASPSASAAALDYAIDTVHTQVHASVSHMGLSNSTARLHVQDGRIRFDPENPAATQVDVTLAVDSLDLGDATWKEHVSAPKWLDAAAFPTIRYVSSAVRPIGEGRYAVDGELHMKGRSAAVPLTVTVNHAGPHPFSKKPALGASATAQFPRSAFGISEGIPVVGDTVSVRIELEATAEPG